MSVGAAELLPGTGGGLELPGLDGAGGVSHIARSPLQLFWRRFRRDRVALVSLGFIALLIVVALAAPLVVSLLGLPGPNVQNPNLTNAFGSPLGPSSAHPFGVDPLGQDVASRVIYGTRVSLIVGIVGTGIATVLGTIVGLLAGYYRGWTDTLLSRLVDVVLAIPVLLLGLGLGAACEVRGCFGGHVQSGLGIIIFLIALVNWTYIARIVRGLVLSLREQEFVAGRPLTGGVRRAHHGSRDPAQPDRADRRLREPADPTEHPARGRPVVPRGRRAPAHRQLGADDRRGHADIQHRLVVHGPSRASPCC